MPREQLGRAGPYTDNLLPQSLIIKLELILNTEKFIAIVQKSLASPAYAEPASHRPVYSEVYPKIKELLGSSLQLQEELREVRSELVRRHFAFGEEIYPFYHLASCLFDATRGDADVKDPSDQEWERAITIAWTNRSNLYSMSPDDQNLRTLHSKDLAIGESIKYLTSLGCELSLSGDQVRLETDAEKKITRRLDQLACSIGGELLAQMTISDLQRTCPFNHEMGQFLIGRRLGPITQPTAAQPPWGYLFNLSLKHINISPRLPRHSAYHELKELATHSLAILGFQPFSQFEETHVDEHHLISYMKKSVLYDSIFTITQMKDSHARLLYTEIWSENEKKEINANGLRLPILIRLADLILNSADKLKAVSISTSAVAKHMNIGKTRAEGYLDSISHSGQAPNENLVFPPAATAITYRERPLVKLRSGDYLILPTSMIAPLLAEFIVEFCASARPTIRDSLGGSVERFIQKQISKKNIDSKSGKYDYRSSKKSDESNQAGDCDVIIESTSHIAFLECKNKLLTRSARSGNDLNLITDLAKSFLHSQTQAMQHESLIKEKGCLNLVSDDSQRTSIDYNDREIERISISLWGFGSLQSDLFISKFLRLCAYNTLSSDQPEDQSVLDSIEKRYLKPLRVLAAKIEDFRGERLNYPVLSMRFLSLSNLLLALDFSDSNDKFMSELLRGKRISTGARDFVMEYSYSRLLESYKPA
jgi:hypothetical protein